MIQPAALPFAGNLLMALGLPGDGAAEPGISADFSTMLAANIAGEPASAVPALAIQPALTAAVGSPGGNQDGKPTGKTGGNILPDRLAGAVRTLANDSAARVSRPKDGPAAEEFPAAMPDEDRPADVTPAAIPLLAPSLGATLGAAGLPQPAGTPLSLATKARTSARFATGVAEPRPVPVNPLIPMLVQSPTPSIDKLRMSEGNGSNGASAVASIHSPAASLPSTSQPVLVLRQVRDERLAGRDQAALPLSGGSPLPTLFQLISDAEGNQPLVALPIAALRAASFTLLRTAPPVVDPVASPQLETVPTEALPQPPSPAGPPPQGLAITPRMHAFQQRIPQGENGPTEAAPPAPTSPAGAPSAETLPLPATSALVPAATQPSTNPANPPPVLSSAPVQPPHDFSALIDRLVEARDIAQASAAPGVVHAAVAHGDFGQVSLQFQQDGGGLTVALTSNDPDFARAVQAAAPAGQTATGSDQGAAPRQDARQDSQQSPGSQFAQSNGQQRHSQSREGGNPRSSANPSQSQRGADEPPPRGGIFA